MPARDYATALAEAQASREQAEADLAAARARTVEAKALAARLRDLRQHIPAIVRYLRTTHKEK